MSLVIDKFAAMQRRVEEMKVPALRKVVLALRGEIAARQHGINEILELLRMTCDQKALAVKQLEIIEQRIYELLTAKPTKRGRKSASSPRNTRSPSRRVRARVK